MKLVEMKCNNCNASLNIDLDNLQAFCPFCGQKLMIDFDQLASLLKEKEKTKQEAIKQNEITRRTKMSLMRDLLINPVTGETGVLTALIVTILCIGFLLLLPRVLDFDLGESEHKQLVKSLEGIVVEIEQDISNADYDSALLKAMRLYCDNYSSSDAETWNSKREAYIKLIKEKMRQAAMADPNNIFMSSSSSSLKGRNYNEVVDLLRNIGFTNITTQIATNSPGLFDKNNTVEHILIGGETDFSINDYFNKETPIIIYYYSK